MEVSLMTAQRMIVETNGLRREARKEMNILTRALIWPPISKRKERSLKEVTPSMRSQRKPRRAKHCTTRRLTIPTESIHK